MHLIQFYFHHSMTLYDLHYITLPLTVLLELCHPGFPRNIVFMTQNMVHIPPFSICLQYIPCSKVSLVTWNGSYSTLISSSSSLRSQILPLINADVPYPHQFIAASTSGYRPSIYLMKKNYLL